LTLKAAVTSALLSALFLVVYSGTNRLSSLRSDVGTWYFPWELELVPFVPLMIIPYMSIDLFFVAAPFLCRDERELRIFARRVTLAILLAGACFLAMPLKLMYVKPEVGGWLGAIFTAFLGFDLPYNLFPSLHIALRTILADTYARHTRGLLRGASNVWFSLIGFSTVLTYQHHLVDILGGFVLAAVCFYAVRENGFRLPVITNPRVGAYYALGVLSAIALTALAWPWGGLLLWPAAALGLVTAAYYGLGPGIYRKAEGRLPLSARFLLAPVLWGQRLSLTWYRRQCRPWDEVAPGVLIGRQLNDTEAARAVREGVTAVLDLTAEFSEARPFLAVTYRHLPILDLTAPTPEQLREAAEFIAAEAARGKVYVHCKIGYSRSAAVIGAYLLSSGQAATAEAAIELLRAARPSIVIRPEALQALQQFEQAHAREMGR
jgi:protein-tyrosine phosphatase/membrane-associated phospholipid phosphatase